MTNNTHGYVMHGLRRASGETKDLTGYYSGRYVQISYDRATGDILTDYHVSLGQNWWTQYHDPEIITVCNAVVPMTMRQIADAIVRRMADVHEAPACVAHI